MMLAMIRLQPKRLTNPMPASRVALKDNSAVAIDGAVGVILRICRHSVVEPIADDWYADFVAVPYLDSVKDTSH